MDNILQYHLALISFVILINSSIGDRECHNKCIDQDTCNNMKIDNICYYLFKDIQRNWKASRKICNEHGLSMVKITKDMIDERYDFSGLFSNSPYETKAWLGGRTTDLSGWAFVNDVFVYGRVNGDADKNFLCGVYTTYTNIEVNRCHDKRPFICRFEPCLPHGKCLEIIYSRKTWFEARSHCISQGGDLFYLAEDKNLDSDMFASLVYNLSTIHSSVHIGLRHRFWEWTDGTEILHTNWEDKEPNKVSEKCLLLYGHNGKWNDNFCLDERHPFCQTDTNSGRATATPSTPITTIAIANGNMSRAENESAQTTEGLLVIILGSLLGLCLIIIFSLTLYVICRKCKCKFSEVDTEIVDNDYYDGTRHPQNYSTTETPGQSVKSPPPTTGHTNAPESTKAYSTITEINGASPISPKPVIKPKPTFGPNGDVYSTVSKPSQLPIKPNDNQTYVNAIIQA